MNICQISFHINCAIGDSLTHIKSKRVLTVCNIFYGVFIHCIIIVELLTLKIF